MSVGAEGKEQTSPRRYSGPTYIACEGRSDCALVARIIRHFNLGKADIGCPSDTKDDGRDGLLEHLKAVLGGTDAEKLRTILIIFDNEDDPVEAIALVRAALLGNGYDIRDQIQLVTPDRTIAIHMIPAAGVPGCIERLLVDASFAANESIERCVREFSLCTGHVASWPPNYQAKAQLQMITASHCLNNPAAPPSIIWSDQQKWADDSHPVPIESPQLSGLVEFLRRHLSPAGG